MMHRQSSMLRFWVALCCCLTCFWTLSAQESEEVPEDDGFRGKMVAHPRFSLGGGVQGGVSTLIFNPQVSTGAFLSVGGGAVARLQTESFAAIQAELNYSQRGWKESYTEQPGHAYTRSLHFVEMPLMAHLFVEFGSVHLFLNVGPQVGYCITNAATATGTSFTDAQQLRHSLPVQHRLAWGLTGGPGLAFCLGHQAGWIEIEGRFYYGLNDVFRNGPADPYGKSAEMYGIVRLSYLIPIGRY